MCLCTGTESARLLSTIWCSHWSDDRSGNSVHVCTTSRYPGKLCCTNRSETSQWSSAASLRWPTYSIIQVVEMSSNSSYL